MFTGDPLPHPVAPLAPDQFVAPADGTIAECERRSKKTVSHARPRNEIPSPFDFCRYTTASLSCRRHGHSQFGPIPRSRSGPIALKVH